MSPENIKYSPPAAILFLNRASYLVWHGFRNLDNGASIVNKVSPMLDQLLHVITPQALGQDRFIGDNMHPQAPHRVYGGQVLAQAVSAAVATVEDDRAIHSQHAYFLRPGQALGVDHL